MPWIPVLIFQITAAVDPYEAGVSLLAAGRIPEARTKLEQAVKQTPGRAQAWKALGVSWAMTGDYDRAEVPFGRACKLAPKLTDVCYFHARALYALNQFAPALVVLEQLRDGLEGRRFSAIGQALEALGKEAGAEAAFKQALGATDHRGESFLRYGIFLFRSGRLEQAGIALESALQLTPKSAEAHAELGRLRYQQENFGEAVRLLKEALAIEPSREAASLLLEKARKLQSSK
jgi:tetratricopeptide (TPR) repeat protein